MSRQSPQPKVQPGMLYSIVFENPIVKYAVGALFLFLLLQPLSLAFASEVEEEQQTETEVVEAVTEQDSEMLSEPSEDTESQIIVDDQIDENQEQNSEVVSAEMEADEPLLEEALENNDSTLETDREEKEDGTVTTDHQEEEAVPSSSEDEPHDDLQETETSDGLDDGMLDEEIDLIQVDTQQQADATETANENVPDEANSSSTNQALVIDHNANQLQFNNNDCTSVGDGAFYCSTAKPQISQQEDGVFTAPDTDGDMEIYVRLDGKESKVTSNTVDDGAPYYDALSDSIVWHTQYNDRYQIMSYDIGSNKSIRLTDTNYNNMQPVAYGDIIMWQAWIDSNWEIMLFDGENLTQLTDNLHHDVSPSIRGGYIVWQSQHENGWQVAVYDQQTQHIEYVRSEVGAKIENPRFVLVYDSKSDSGDVQTLGYDFDRNTSFTLNSLPADIPEELPEPDQTGETRALIQNKHSIRGTEIEESEPITAGNGTTTPAINNSATTTAQLPSSGGLTLDLSQASSSHNIENARNDSASTTPAMQELVITPQEPTMDGGIPHIEDVVIPPMLSASTTEVR